MLRVVHGKHVRGSSQVLDGIGVVSVEAVSEASGGLLLGGGLEV